MSSPALLALADGSVLRGESCGAAGAAVGELVFNTSMSGYQEILTDPSYTSQIITFTYPHIGNVGVNPEDDESDKIHAAAMVVRDVSRRVSNYRATGDLPGFLDRHKVPAITGVDTRRLTTLLREAGAIGACVAADGTDAEKAVAMAREFGGLSGLDLAKEVTTGQPYEWTEGEWLAKGGFAEGKGKRHVVVYDFGVKRSILRRLAQRGMRLTVVPAATPAEEVLAMKPDGVVLSNGPGDPEPCAYAIAAIQKLLEEKIPLLGICLGFQLLALAAGGRTVKMKFGHHGANHPVRDLEGGRVLVTSQNHGFAVDEEKLPTSLTITHRSLFDGTVQGIAHTGAPAMGFQGHPEAGPGPNDALPLFDAFRRLLEKGNA